MDTTQDRYTLWYQGIQRIYRNAVVDHIRAALSDKYPLDWEEVVKKPFLKEWTTIVSNAEMPRITGAVKSEIRDASDFLGVNHFYNLLDAHFDLLFPTDGQIDVRIRKEEKNTVLNWVKEIRTARDSASHPASEDMDVDDLIRQLDSAQRICLKFNREAAGTIGDLKRRFYATLPPDVDVDVDGVEDGATLPIQASLPPRESISPEFIGREAELEQLRSWLRDPPSRLWLLAGDGGKGKTALAYQFASMVQQNAPEPFEFIIWLSAKRRRFVDRQITDVPVTDFDDFESALDHILTEYGWSGELAEDVDVKKQAVLEYFEHLPALVILDDINSLEGDIMNALSFFVYESARTRSKFLFTSRLIPFGMDTLTTQISGFPPRSPEGHQFIESRIRLFGLDKTAFNTRSVDEILRVTDGSPLYIEDLLRLALLGGGIERVLQEWKDHQGRAAREYALGREFDLLSSDAALVLLIAAHYNAPVSTAEITVAAGRELNLDRVQNSLAELQKLFLVPRPRIVEDIPRFTLNQNTRDLVLDVMRDRNPDLFEKIDAAVRATSGNATASRRDRLVVGNYIRQAVSLVKLDRHREAEQTLKKGLESIPETPDLYGHLGWVYWRWKPYPRATDARENFKRASELKCRNADMYFHWCQLEKENRAWTRMSEAAKTGIKVIEDDLNLHYLAGYAHSRLAYDLLSYDQLERAEDEAEEALRNLENVLIDPELLEPGQYRLHSMAFQSMVLTMRTLARIMATRRDDRGINENLKVLGDTLRRWNAEHPGDPNYSRIKDDTLRFYPSIQNQLHGITS